MLDIRKLKELVRLMVNNDLTELDLRDSEEQVTLRRHGPGGAPQVVTVPTGTTAPAAAAAPGATAVAEAPDSDLPTIDSPMVGTFYSAPNPDSPPFVSVGSSVDAETVVCLVEAMKIFNEIKAECTGTIEKALVSNGESVEFGQPLFKVRPS
ncbi:MAG: acetyl-CoA carboxylase biotin carboxyl carrier protein [Planctomycetota bacterium]|jgi:acetyl-CoA carboxylase biotin carboxyl carrier protein